MRVLVTGDRNWNEIDIIKRELEKFPPGTTIIHGNARGADTKAAFIANRLGFDVVPYRAKWEVYGKGAGPIRNQVMIDEGRPDMVIAFHKNIDESKGTKDMVNRAKKAGLKVILISK